MSHITIGADPELFVMDATTKKIVPVCGRVGGTKAAPLRMRSDWPETYAFQEDNVMLEFNIPPATNAAGFQSAIKHAIDHTAIMLSKRGLAYSPCTTEHLFHRSDLAVHKQAQEFGCSPDFDAYTSGSPNRKVAREELVQADKEWRFCGGHVHLGYTAKIPPFAVAGLMDVALGLQSIGEDSQNMRRKFYGTAGRYRPTKYGIEYRTLSNYWIWNTGYANRIAQRVLALGQHLHGSVGILQSYYTKMPWQDIKTAIDTNNVELASQIYGYINDEVGFKLNVGGNVG